MGQQPRLLRAFAAVTVCAATFASTGCGERYDLGPASFSVSTAGTLRIVVCEDLELSTVSAYLTRGAGSINLLDLDTNEPVRVGAGEDILAAVEGQSVEPVTRNIAALVEEVDYIGIYLEGTANGVEESWTAGIRAPFSPGANAWMKPDGSVVSRPC